MCSHLITYRKLVTSFRASYCPLIHAITAHYITLKLRSTPCCYYETLASKHSKFRGEIVRSLGKTYKTIKFYFVLLVARGQNLISNSNRVGRRKMMTNNEKKKRNIIRTAVLSNVFRHFMPEQQNRDVISTSQIWGLFRTIFTTEDGFLPQTSE